MKKRPKTLLKDTNGRHFPKLDTLILAFLPEMKRKKRKGKTKHTNTSHHSLERLGERQPPPD
jgi:hypothetical protein